MKRILISGICGFAGSTTALRLRQLGAGTEITGFDIFIRAGSETNRLVLKRHGIVVQHADARSATDVEALPAVDWVIDAAANPSVLAGAGQFGRPDQGIISFCIHSWLCRKSLKYTGFGGSGHQVRDCLQPPDLVPVLMRQRNAGADGPKIINLGGGVKNSLSLAQLSTWCAARFGPREGDCEMAPRPFDIPWLVLDSSRAERLWGFRVTTPMEAILNEIADHAREQPDWLEISAS
jgi:nucleoside-diphosphate-sugar epimerase